MDVGCGYREHFLELTVLPSPKQEMRQLFKLEKSSICFLRMLLVSGRLNLSGCEHRATVSLEWELIKTQSCNLLTGVIITQPWTSVTQLQLPLEGILFYHFAFSCFFPFFFFLILKSWISDIAPAIESSICWALSVWVEFDEIPVCTHQPSEQEQIFCCNRVVSSVTFW